MRKRITLALLSMLLVPLAMMAQSVTVDPNTGKLIAALTHEGEVGFENGWSAMWRHEQLPLTLTVADGQDENTAPSLTPAGEFSDPACNMREENNNLIIGGGPTIDSYWILSLPKGYRFKGYKLVLLDNLNYTTVSGISFGYSGNSRIPITKVMYETDNTFSTNNYKARGAFDNTTTYLMPGNNSNTNEYVLERMSDTSTDMGNQLYFRLAHNGYSYYGRQYHAYYGVTIKSFTVYFTAEGTFEAEAKPASADVALSLVRSPFKTNKMDIGKLENKEKNGKTYFAYTYTNVRDIDAHTYIYQDDAVASGVPMNVASKKKIHPVTIGGKQYYAFENGVYYVEAPTQVYSQTGLSYPIGFRIVGAKFTPQWGSAVTGTSETKTLYYITYTSEEGETYYLNDLLHFTTTKFGWNYDSDTHNVYVGSGNNAEYLACEGSGGERRLTLSYANGSYYNLEVSGTEIGWPSYGYYLRGTTDPAATVYMTNSSATNDHAQVSSGSETVTMASYSPGAYTLNIYDKTGTSIVATKTVSSASAAGTAIELKDKATYGYNNDAIKFEISGLPTNGSQQALVDVSVFMQALNPYIDQMNIVCHDPSNTIELSQPFDAQNFRVSGGQIKFNIPSGYTGNLNFTFKDLYSQYGDNTYYTGTSKEKDGYARYSFVTSPYFYDFNEVKGDGTNDVSTDVGLYDVRYVGTGEGTDIQPGAALAYTTKVYANTAGNIRFKFNNAENLSNTNPTPNTNYLEEYPFSVTAYQGSANPDGGSMTGSFVTPTMNAQATESSTYYVFTADETRYNIAPSSNWQHRYYAFYRMEIDLQTDTYVPNLGWTKVYDNTCYNKNGSAAYDAMWGLKLTTVKEGSTTPVEGYLTVKEISDAITAALTASGTNHPTSADQIIYVDAGDLHTIQNSTVTSGGQTTTMDIGTLQQSLSKNVMIYLPSTITSFYDNCAKKTSNWSTGDPYYATRDIVLTDNVPFYAPYDIYVDVDNVIKHERKITVPKNGKVTSASIIMPFDIQIDANGIHTNLDGQQFKLHKMASTNCLTTGDGADFVYFPVVSGVSAAPANKPYLVQVLNVPDDNQISFVLSQKGGTIKATTGYATQDPYKYTYQGETGSGSKDGVTYTFTNHGSYSGKLLAKADNFFYYWKNQFVRSNDYSYDADIKIAPFRTYYSSVTGNGAKALQSFDVLFDDGNETDGIMMNEFGTIDVNAPVYDLQGRKLANSLLDSSLGKGVYIINGVKIIIK